MKRDEIVIGIRWTLTLVLLLVVWLNAHWSVALTLTLIALRSEVEYLRSGR